MLAVKWQVCVYVCERIHSCGIISDYYNVINYFDLFSDLFFFFKSNGGPEIRVNISIDLVKQPHAAQRPLTMFCDF